MISKKDPRYQRTHYSIQSALIELILLKPLNKITIEDIAQKANINRSTFYLHYGCINDLINEFIIGGFTLDHGAPTYEEVYINPRKFIERTERGLDFLFSSSKLMETVLLEFQINPYFRSFYDTHIDIQYAIQQVLVNNQINGFVPDPYIAKFVLGGQVAILYEWLKKRPDVSLKQLAIYLNSIQHKTICTLIGVPSPDWVKEYETLRLFVPCS